MEIEDAAKEYAGINEDKAANSAHSYSKYDIADAYQQGYNLAVSRLRWIPIEEKLPKIGMWILIQLKNQPTKNKYVTMLPKNDFEIQYIKENVISWRSFL